MKLPSDETRRRDAGLTLPEILISITISGMLIVAISVAFSVMLRSEGGATTRLAVSKDVTFIQTWLPLDLSSALETTDSPAEADVKATLANLPAPIPNMAYNGDLPGTNVITIVRPDLERSYRYYVVAYRYAQVGDEWQLMRYEIRNPGGPDEDIKVVGVAHELPPPEDMDTWVDGTERPTHAVTVTSRNQVILRPIGEDITVTFDSGDEFTTGGAGLSAENVLPTDYSGQLIDPSAPPSRCGGRLAIVLDTSGSVPKQHGGNDLESAAVGFLEAFTGTPTYMQVIGFDYDSYVMTSDDGNFGTYFSMLNDPAVIEAAKTRITDLPDQDGTWTKNSNEHLPIHWEQMLPTGSSAGATNWEAGLWDAVMVHDPSKALHARQPDLIVFVTDGEPNRARDDSDLSSDGENRSKAADEGAEVAEIARSAGARLVGVLVGNDSDDTDAVNNLKKVVGNNEWDGSVTENPDGTFTIDVADAASADIFLGEFDQLGGVLRSIMVAECGGTVTVQKKIDTGGSVVTPDSGVWQYTTSVGTRELDRSETSSITFDYTFEDGVVEQTVQITESVVPGYVWKEAICSVGGDPVDASDAQPNDDGSPGVTVTVRADQAVSCQMISEPIVTGGGADD